MQVFGEPPPTIPDLIGEVEALGLPRGIENSLVAKLGNAQAGIDRGRTGSTFGRLAAFVAEIEAQRGKKLADASAAGLLADVRELTSSLECSQL